MGGGTKMKQLLIGTVLTMSVVFLLAACGTNEESGDYNPGDYDMTLLNSDFEETEVLEEGEKALYLYFTGVD
jgi:uncharacterized lipoprotein YehR (DUF1307 family)